MKPLLVLAGFSALLLAGCASGTYVSEDTRTGFQNGTTTEQQVIADIGQPQQTGLTVAGGKSDTYTWLSGETPVDYVPIVSLLVGPDSEYVTVTFEYNAQGVLVDSKARRWSSDT
jgi:hypothetical protein